MGRGKRILFWGILLATPVLAFGVLEIAARVLARTEIARDPKINLVDQPTFFERKTVGGFEPPTSSYDEDGDVRMHAGLLSLFGIMHQYEPMVEKARKLERLGAGDAPAVRPILEVFPPYLEAERRALLGEPLAPCERARTSRAVERFYQAQLGAMGQPAAGS